MCYLRLLLLVQLWWHTLHSKGFSPEWMRMWRFRLQSLRVRRGAYLGEGLVAARNGAVVGFELIVGARMLHERGVLHKGLAALVAAQISGAGHLPPEWARGEAVRSLVLEQFLAANQSRLAIGSHPTNVEHSVK